MVSPATLVKVLLHHQHNPKGTDRLRSKTRRPQTASHHSRNRPCRKFHQRFSTRESGLTNSQAAVREGRKSTNLRIACNYDIFPLASSSSVRNRGVWRRIARLPGSGSSGNLMSWRMGKRALKRLKNGGHKGKSPVGERRVDGSIGDYRKRKPRMKRLTERIRIESWQGIELVSYRKSNL